LGAGVAAACGAAGSVTGFDACGTEVLWVRPTLQKVKIKTAAQNMRAMVVEPGMGEFPFCDPFKAELLNQNWMQECVSRKRKGLLTG
jgi:hypothetical protein